MNKLSLSDIKDFYTLVNYTPIEILAKDEKQCRAMEIKFSLTARPWKIASQLFIKKMWNSQYRVSGTRKEKLIYETNFEVVNAMYNLIKEIITLKEHVEINFSDNFPNNSNEIKTLPWLARCIVDFTAFNFYSQTYEKLPKIYNNNIKESFIEIERNRLRQLKANINPFPEECFGLHNLVQAGLDISKIMDQFEKNYWKPFLKAYAQIPKTMKSKDYGIAHIKDNLVTIQKGRGRPPKKT